MNRADIKEGMVYPVLSVVCISRISRGPFVSRYIPYLRVHIAPKDRGKDCIGHNLKRKEINMRARQENNRTHVSHI